MNCYINTWKTTVEAIKAGYKTITDKDFDVSEYAQRQLINIEENRPNKDKTAKQQATKEQIEFIEYLEKVCETGEL